jgi:cell division cycle 2-like protein
MYSTSLDMWSVGCIFAEILARKPLFPGEGEIDQVTKICRILGAPNEANWPGFSKLPDVSKVSWKAPTRGTLKELFPPHSFSGGVILNDTGFDMLSKLLLYDPKTRMSAKDAVNHTWFKELPLSCSLSDMPEFKSRHERNAVTENSTISP